MFDTISVSDVLPYTQEMKDLGLDNNNHSWQTKDLYNTLSQYFIQGGRLFEQRYKVESFIPGDPNSKNFIDKLGRMDRQEPYLEPINFHGEIYFYNSVRDVQDKWDCWLEFKAVFTNSVVDRYELVKFKKEDNAERKKLDEEWVESLTKSKNLWYNKYFFYSKPYRWFANKWYRVFAATGNFCHELATML